MQKTVLGIQFKYTALSTPHQNSQVEQKFATLWDFLCAMIEGTLFSSELHQKLWSEAANMAKYLDNYILLKVLSTIQIPHFLGRDIS